MSQQRNELTIPEAIASAMELQNQQKFQQAESVYRQILSVEPDNADALHLLGLILHGYGRAREALDLINRAIAQNDNGLYYSNLAAIALSTGDTELALHSYRKTVELTPENIQARYTLAHTLQDNGDTRQAIKEFSALLEIDETHMDAANELGTLYYQQQEFSSAVEMFQLVLRLDSQHPDALFNLAASQLQARQYQQCIKNFQKVLASTPNSISALSDLASAFQVSKNFAESQKCFDKIFSLQSGTADIYENYSGMLREKKDLSAAIDMQRQALRLATEDSYYRRRVQLEGLKYLACLWGEEDDLSAEELEEISLSSNQISVFLYSYMNTTAQQQLRCAQNNVPVVKTDFPSRPKTVIPLSRAKIRIGYLSGDYRQHPVSDLMIGILENHDKKKFEIIGYSINTTDDSEIMQRTKKALDRFVDLNESNDEQIINKIREDEVDILIDLGGHTGKAKVGILCNRAAPVQVNYLGYTGTIGSKEVDYILADEEVIPGVEEDNYSENVVRLPLGYQTGDSKRPVSSEEPSREQFGLPAQGMVFCCFNAAHKITQPIYGSWMKLLKSISRSVLWLTKPECEYTVENLLLVAQSMGIEPDRIIFAEKVDYSEHMSRHLLADIFLDTYPYNAHATANDSLWAGCPVVTLCGDTFVSRVGASLLKNTGLSELITYSLEQYQGLIIELANDPARLHGFKTHLREKLRNLPLFDNRGFTRKFEKALTTMWENHCAGRPPAPFSVE